MDFPNKGKRSGMLENREKDFAYLRRPVGGFSTIDEFMTGKTRNAEVRKRGGVFVRAERQ